MEYYDVKYDRIDSIFQIIDDSKDLDDVGYMLIGFLMYQSDSLEKSLESKLTFPNMMTCLDRYQILNKELVILSYLRPELKPQIDEVLDSYSRRIEKRRYSLLDKSSDGLKKLIIDTIEEKVSVQKANGYVAKLREYYLLMGFLGQNVESLNYTKRILGHLKYIFEHGGNMYLRLKDNIIKAKAIYKKYT